MIALLCGILIPLAYLAVALAVAPPIYGRIRARRIDYIAENYYHLAASAGGAEKYYAGDGPGEYVFYSALLALAWPAFLTLPACRAYMRYVGKTAKLSNYELANKAREQERYIARLEREAGIW